MLKENLSKKQTLSEKTPTHLVNRVLFRGRYQSTSNPLSTGNLKYDMWGGATCTIEGYKCPRCNLSSGYIFTDEYGTLYFCGTTECLKDDSSVSMSMRNNEKPPVQDAVDMYGIGSRYRNASLSKWMATQSQQKKILNWMENPKNAVVITGAPNTGKTYFCVALANRFMEKGKQVYYTNAHRLMESVTKSISEGKNQYDALNNISKKPILILDDFGTASSSDWAKEIMFDLIDQRYNSQLPTIYTTNLSFDDIAEIYNERTARRLNAPENLKIIIGQEI